MTKKILKLSFLNYDLELDQFYKHLNTLEPTTELTKNVSIEPKLVLRQIMYKSLKMHEFATKTRFL